MRSNYTSSKLCRNYLLDLKVRVRILNFLEPLAILENGLRNTCVTFVGFARGNTTFPYTILVFL